MTTVDHDMLIATLDRLKLIAIRSIRCWMRRPETIVMAIIVQGSHDSMAGFSDLGRLDSE